MTDPDRDSGAGQTWHRWGWLVGGIWLVFLIFPIMAVMETYPEPRQRIPALVLVGAFAATYALAFVAITRVVNGVRRPWVLLLVLTALLCGVATQIGIDSLAMAPFVVSYAVWAYPWPRGAWLASGLAGIAIVTLAVVDLAGRWFFAVPILLVLGFTAMMRTLDSFSMQQAELSEVMAVVSERERVARDVHDVLGHSLTAISVKAELASRLIEVDGPRAAQELEQVQTLAREALAEIRVTVAGLRVTRIDDELAVAQESLTAAGIETDLPAESDGVDVSNRIVLAWALREATTNVIRHSGATRCVVTLGPRTLVVTDDGVGGTGVEGNGLRGLRERVGASGGTVTLGPGPDGHGHELKVEL